LAPSKAAGAEVMQNEHMRASMAAQGVGSAREEAAVGGPGAILAAAGSPGSQESGPMHAAPTATNLNMPQTYTEDRPLDLADIVVSDPDGDFLAVTLRLSNPAAGRLTTSIFNGVSSNYDAATGVWTALGFVNEINALLAAVSFVPVLDHDGNLTISVAIDDLTTVVTGAVALIGTPVNDAPGGTDTSVFMGEDRQRTLQASDFGLDDHAASSKSEGQSLAAVVISTLPTAGTLTLNGVAVRAGQTVSAAQLAAGQLVFAPAPNANGAGYASFTFQVQDDGGTANGGIDTDHSPNTITVHVNPLNDPPTATNLDTPQTYIEDTALDLADIVVNDADGDFLEVTLRLSNPAAGRLTTSTVSGVQSTYDAASGLWTVFGSPDAINPLLAAVGFVPATDFNGDVTIAARVDDLSTVLTGVIPLTGAPVDDPPAGADKTLILTEDTDLRLHAADFGFSDADGHNLAGVVLTTLPAAGALRLDGAGVAAGQFIAAADLGRLVYTPAANASGSPYASFTFQVRDTGEVADGGRDTDQSPNTLTLDVAPVNDAPSVAIMPSSGTIEVVAAGFSGNKPTVIALAEGKFLIAFARSNILDGRIFTNGIPSQLGNLVTSNMSLVARDAQLDNIGYAVLSLPDGGFAYLWETRGGGGSSGEIGAQRLSAAGALVSVSQNPTLEANGDQYAPAAVASGTGIIAAWRNDFVSGVSLRFLRPSGADTNTTTVSISGAEEPALAALPGGGAVIVWEAVGAGSEGRDLYAQRLNGIGARIGSPVLVNGVIAGSQENAAVAAFSDGGFVVVWESDDGDGFGIFGRRFDAAGAPVGGDFRVNTTTAGVQSDPAVAVLPNGEFVVLWAGPAGRVFGQRFDATAGPIGGEFLVTANGVLPSVAALTNGDVVAAWGLPGINGVYAQQYHPSFRAVEQQALSLKAAITLTDVDAGLGILTATLSVPYGILSLSAGASGATIVGGNGTGRVVVSGTLAQLNALLHGDPTSVITFTPNSDAPPAATTLAATINDGAETGSASASIAIAAIDDPGSLSGLAARLTVPTGAAPRRLDADVSYADPDGLPSGARLVVNGLLAEDRVAISHQGDGPGQIGVAGSVISYGGTAIATFSGGVGAPLTISFSAPASSAAVEALVENLTYANASLTPTAERTLLIAVDDGHSHPAFAERSGAANPLGALSGPDVSLAIGDTDGDGDQDLVVARPGEPLALHRGEAGAFSLAPAPNAVAAIALPDGYRGPVSVAAGDLDGDGRDDLVMATDQRITAYRATDSGFMAMASMLHSGPRGPSWVALADVDRDGAPDIVVGTDAGGILVLFQQGGGFAERPADNPFGAITGRGLAPAFGDLDGDGDVDLVLGTAQGAQSYRNDGGAFVPLTGAANPLAGLGLAGVVRPFFGDVTGDGRADLSLSVDGGALRLHENRLATIALAMGAPNAAPAHNFPASLSAREDELSPLHGGVAIDPPPAWVSDSDSASVTTTLAVADGSFIVDAQGSATVTGSGTNQVTISGTPDAVNRTIYYGVRYLSAADANGPRTITVTTSDGDATTMTNVALSITPVADAPSGTDGAVQATEDTPYVFGAADFGFSDADGDMLGSVIVETLPLQGKLVDIGGYVVPMDVTGDGVPDVFLAAPARDLVAGDKVSRSLLDGGYIRYLPAADANGDGAASFTFRVVDNSNGGPRGAAVAAAATNLLTIDIAAVNDAPVNTAPGAQGTAEDAPLTILGLAVADADLDEDGGAITVTLSVLNGTLDLVDGSAIVGLVTGAGSDTLVIVCDPALINQALASGIVYTPDPDYAGPDTLTITTDDGGASGADPGGDPLSESDVDMVAIAVAAANDAPTIAASAVRNDVAEGSVFIFGPANLNAILIDDVDDATLTVTLAALNGVLTLARTSGLTVTGDGSASVSLSGSLADIAAALDGLSYRANSGFTGADRLTVTADDGDDTTQRQLAIAVYEAGLNGDDDLTGTPDPDYFALQQGGNDRVVGLAGDDGFFFGAAFGAGDRVDGGGGDADELALRGDYSLVLDGTMLRNVEVVALLSGADTSFGGPGGLLHDYALTLSDDVTAPGAVLTVNANGLAAGEDFAFDGGAETDGSFRLFGGFGREILTGGAGSDGFFFGDGRFSTAGAEYDRVDGSAGEDDQLALRGSFFGPDALLFLSDSIRNIDTIALISSQDPRYAPAAGPFAYEITVHDDNVAAGARLTVNGNGLLPSEFIIFDGSAEMDGSFFLIGGGCDDWLIGGAQDDVIYGNLGSDIMEGGLGADRFVYLSAAEASPPLGDLIADFAAGDLIDLSRIDANPLDGDQAFTFIDCGCFSGTAGELRAIEDEEGVWMIEGDLDGDGVADFVLAVQRVDDTPFTAADFML
jgi:hypothetical protein